MLRFQPALLALTGFLLLVVDFNVERYPEDLAVSKFGRIELRNR